MIYHCHMPEVELCICCLWHGEILCPCCFWLWRILRLYQHSATWRCRYVVRIWNERINLIRSKAEESTCTCIHKVSMCFLLPDPLFPGCVWVLSSEVHHRTPHRRTFWDDFVDIYWIENRRLVLVHHCDGDCAGGGGHWSGKRCLIRHHHQKSKDRNTLKIQLLINDGNQE